jgi:hypothetical protein
MYKNKHLIESLKSCIIRAGHANLINRDLLIEIINVARDVHTNPLGDILEEFYKDYVLKIILNDTICDLTYVDRNKNRYAKVFEEVVDNLVQLYNDEEISRDNYSKKLGGKNFRRTDQPREFFTLGTANVIYKKLLNLIVRYSETEHIKQTKKLAYILMRIIVRD